ncbi:hypothetical protein MRX96_005247 [Rhipicephalus microplus]
MVFRTVNYSRTTGAPNGFHVRTRPCNLCPQQVTGARTSHRFPWRCCLAVLASGSETSRNSSDLFVTEHLHALSLFLPAPTPCPDVVHVDAEGPTLFRPRTHHLKLSVSQKQNHGNKSDEKLPRTMKVTCRPIFPVGKFEPTVGAPSSSSRHVMSHETLQRITCRCTSEWSQNCSDPPFSRIEVEMRCRVLQHVEIDTLPYHTETLIACLLHDRGIHYAAVKTWEHTT